MADVEETELPGVGIRYDFLTHDGERVGVLVHRTGRRDMLLYDPADPDACRATLQLREDDAHALAELLGASSVTQHLAAMQQEVAGLTIDWVTVEASSPLVGDTLAEAAIHTQTGVSVVAIVRGAETIAAPGAGDRLEADDVLVAVGTADGIRRLFDLLAGIDPVA